MRMTAVATFWALAVLLTYLCWLA